MKKIAIFTLFPRLALAPFFARAKHRRSRYSIFLYLSTQRRRLLRKLEKTVIKCCIDLKACHTDRKCSQSHHRKPVIYYTVSHPTFPSCAARMSVFTALFSLRGMKHLCKDFLQNTMKSVPLFLLG